VILVDSSGWVEFIVDGPLADQYAPVLVDEADIVVPTVVLYEVYKWVRREHGEDSAMRVAGQMTRCRIVPLDQTVALTAADDSLRHGLAMADAVIYATARAHGAELITSDRDFDGLDGVRYVSGP